MATISRYQNTSGATRYRVRYRTPERGQTQRRGFKTKRDAEAFAATVEVSKLKGEYVAPALGRVSVDELATDWLARKKQATAPSHYRMLNWPTALTSGHSGVRSAWRRRHARHRSVDRRDGQRRHHRTARAWGAVRNARRCGQGQAACRQPGQGCRNLPRKTAKRHVYLSADDVHRLADESGAHRALVLTLAYTGIRWGEAVALRVRDVEFLRRRLAVSENAVQLGTRHAVGPTKGRKARSVPVPAFVLDELSAQCKGKAPGDLRLCGPRRRLSAAAKVVDRTVPGCGQTCRGADHHAARLAAHLRQSRGQRRGQCACAATHAWAHFSEDDVGHLQRPV